MIDFIVIEQNMSMLHCVLINKAWVQQGVTDNLQIINSCGDRYPVCGAGLDSR